LHKTVERLLEDFDFFPLGLCNIFHNSIILEQHSPCKTHPLIFIGNCAKKFSNFTFFFVVRRKRSSDKKPLISSLPTARGGIHSEKISFIRSYDF